MSSTTYVKYELLRTVRNRRFFFFTLAFPLILFLVFGASNKNHSITLSSGQTIKYALYYMVAMAGYGSMLGAISGGARIAAERAVGWNRQLRLTPLRPWVYFATKIVTTYLMCLLSILVIFLAGLTLGAHVDTTAHIVEMVLLILVGLLPFVGIGVFIGHLLTPDSMGPVMGGGGALFALVGGMWFPLSGTLNTIGQYTPGYWIAQAARVGLGGGTWGAKGWLVVAVWTVVSAAASLWAYRRDTQRV